MTAATAAAVVALTTQTAAGGDSAVVDPWARGLAIAGLLASLGALTWQIVQWRLNGARVLVSLRVMAEMSGGRRWSATFDEQAEHYMLAHRYTPTGVQVQVTVRNRGRAAVHIEDYWLSINGTEGRRMGAASEDDPTLPLELKPGASARFTQSISQTVLTFDDIGAGPYKVRAQVELGDGRSRWSPRRPLVIPKLD